MSDCCGSNQKPLVYACSGGSNVGQLTNEAAKVLDDSGDANMSCLAGLGGNISGMVASAKSGNPLLILDGCPVACGKKIADNLGLQNYAYVDVMSLGIKKEHNVMKTPKNEIEQVVEAGKKALKGNNSCCS